MVVLRQQLRGTVELLFVGGGAVCSVNAKLNDSITDFSGTSLMRGDEIKSDSIINVQLSQPPQNTPMVASHAWWRQPRGSPREKVPSFW